MWFFKVNIVWFLIKFFSVKYKKVLWRYMLKVFMMVNIKNKICYMKSK